MFCLRVLRYWPLLTSMELECGERRSLYHFFFYSWSIMNWTDPKIGVRIYFHVSHFVPRSFNFIAGPLFSNHPPHSDCFINLLTMSTGLHLNRRNGVTIPASLSQVYVSVFLHVAHFSSQWRDQERRNTWQVLFTIIFIFSPFLFFSIA